MSKLLKLRHFKYVLFMVYQVYLNKVVTKRIWVYLFHLNGEGPLLLFRCITEDSQDNTENQRERGILALFLVP